MSDDSNRPDPTKWPPPRYPAFSIEEQQRQYAELRHREVLSRAFQIELAEGEDEPGEPVGPPLTAAEHLEMIRLGERIAESYRHPGRMGEAVEAARPGRRSPRRAGPTRPPPGGISANGPYGCTTTA